MVPNFPANTVTHPGIALLMFKPNIRSGWDIDSESSKITPSWIYGGFIVFWFIG